MTETDTRPAGDPAAHDTEHDASSPSAEKLVPVAESIKYRRRAQQAEARLEQLQQQLDEARGAISQRDEQLASAEAQRDQVQYELQRAENRRRVERTLQEAGVADVETASLLLERRMDLEDFDDDHLAQGIEELLIDKPFLAAVPASLPPSSASSREGAGGAAARVADAARRAASSGNRRDIAEYLRLKRSFASG